MIYNHTSILITNLLFYNIDNLLYKTTGINTIAHSPVMDCSPRSVAIHHEIVIVTQSKEIIIRISISNFTIDEFLKIQNYFSEIADNLHYILQIVFKKKFTIKDEKDINKNIYTVHNKEIDISVINHNGEKYIQFFIPIEFFRLFSKNISLNAPSDVIEDDVLNFFKNPKWMIPDSQFVLTSLSTVELGTLINQLLTRNQLTTYQLFLVLQAFPDLSGTIKNVLSKNIISDVIQFNKTAGKLKINRRDVTGGIYSIEESMYFILRDDDDIQYSHILRSIQLLIQSSLNLELLLRKSFIEWISVIAADDLLHAAVSITDDAVMANALTRDRDRCIEIMNNFLTERKINDILILINDNTPLDEIIRARIEFLLNYRKLKMKRTHSHPDRLGYLLAHFSRPGDYVFLLLSVGWFTLSTALKGTYKKNAARVLRHLPLAARILIEDVLRGIVNPNILHDEMQVNKAKTVCVDVILMLYNDGIINLEL